MSQLVGMPCARLCLDTVQEPAQDSTTGEVVLGEVDAAADQPRLEDAYSTILQQAGLSGDELQTALTAWMAYMAKEVSQVADRLAERLGRIRGSRAAELIIEERLATAVNMVAGALTCWNQALTCSARVCILMILVLPESVLVLGLLELNACDKHSLLPLAIWIGCTTKLLSYLFGFAQQACRGASRVLHSTCRTIIPVTSHHISSPAQKCSYTITA